MRSKTKEDMTMNLKNRGLAETSFEELSNSISETDKILIETRLLMYGFLSEIDKITSDRGINRKELAKLAGVSASYLTQLYQGKKIINLQMLTKIKKALDIDFKIEVVYSERRSKSERFEIAPITFKSTSRKHDTRASVHATHVSSGLLQNKTSKTGRRPEKSF
jgi:transcriptional regulator with XRE-family HTH domain